MSRSEPAVRENTHSGGPGAAAPPGSGRLTCKDDDRQWRRRRPSAKTRRESTADMNRWGRRGIGRIEAARVSSESAAGLGCRERRCVRRICVIAENELLELRVQKVRSELEVLHFCERPIAGPP